MSAALYVVTYIDVDPAAADRGASLLKEFGAAGRRDDGNLWLDVLRRTVQSNQFVYVAGWRDQASFDFHQNAPHTRQFTRAITPHLIGPFDQRTHAALAIEAHDATVWSEDTICVVTHVDVPPPFKDPCVEALRELVAGSRNEAGVVRFEVFQQNNRSNHFSVVAVLQDEQGYLGHISAGHTKKFREQLGSMLGAPYDERLYKML